MKFDSDEIKGFAITDKYAPFVFVNTEDWKAPQLFTLVHELAHIWIGQSGVSNESDLELKLRHQIHQVEAFCNEVAAAALMPNESMNRLDRNIFKSQVELFTTAKNWGVSSFALLVRALHLNLISMQEYRILKIQADLAYKQHLVREEVKREKQKNESEGGPNYYQLQLNKVSPHFTRFVLEGYHSGSIPPTQASSLLNVKTNNFPKLEQYLSTQA
jgi:Zn-dependent peptidase ImmA (M78 family)